MLLRSVALALLVWGSGPACKRRTNPSLSPSRINGVEDPNHVHHEREFRGAWIATVENIDWPSKKGLSADEQKKEMIRILDNLKKYRINAALFQTRPEGDAMYKSALEPWSRFLSGTQGVDPGYDPLEFFVKEAHARGIQAHVWLNPYRAKANQNNPVVAPHIGATAPEYVYNYRTLAWMDPGAKVVEDQTYNVVMDMVERYDIDGVHIDDYFYPYPDQTPFPDDKTYEAYKKSGGTLERSDWRRENVNRLIERLAKGIKKVKPYVAFGISPFGIYRPGQPEGVKGLDQYEALFADPKKWTEEKWLDYIAPQLYWPIASKGQPYEKLLDWWSKLSTERYTYSGHSTTHVAVTGDQHWPTSEIIDQVKITRRYRAQLALGDIFFSAKNVFNNTQNLGDELAKLYERPALPPPINWENRPAPVPPEVTLASGKATITHADLEGLRSFVIYKEENGRPEVWDVVSQTGTQWTPTTGKWFVTAVDRAGMESDGTALMVP